MPRTVQEILGNADDLAARFESYEPKPADEVDVAEYARRRNDAARDDKPGGQ